MRSDITVVEIRIHGIFREIDFKKILCGQSHNDRRKRKKKGFEAPLFAMALKCCVCILIHHVTVDLSFCNNSWSKSEFCMKYMIFQLLANWNVSVYVE